MSKARTLGNLVSGASTSTIPNSALTNSAVTINSQSVSLGGSVTLWQKLNLLFQVLVHLL